MIPVTSLILASSALGEERGDKTLSFVLLRPIGRLKIVIAKTLAAALFDSEDNIVRICTRYVTGRSQCRGLMRDGGGKRGQARLHAVRMHR